MQKYKLLKHIIYNKKISRKMKINNEDEDEITNIKVINNNIFFYCDVNRNTVLKLIMELKKLENKLINKKKKYINLFINSNGGYVHDSFAVVDFIKSMKIPVHGYVQGIAASSAATILVVCHKRFIYKHSYMLIHQLNTTLSGKYEELQNEMLSCDSLMNDIVNIYKDNTKLTEVKLKKILKKDIWWNAKICLKYGLVDSII